MSKMKLIIPLMIICFYMNACSQSVNGINKKLTINKASKEYTFGKPNPNAPSEIKDFDKLIGNCNCKSLQYANGKPLDTLQLKWKWKYILNGYGIQDEGWYGKDSLKSSFTSIRIFNPETKKWHVPFFTPNMTKNPDIWIGGKVDKDIVLKRSLKTPSSEAYESVLTFSDITNRGFYWEGKIFIPATNTTNIFWKIWCVKEDS